MKTLILRILELALATGCALFLTANCCFALKLEREETLMSTSVKVILCGPDRNALERAMDAGFTAISDAEKLTSFFRADSEIAEINRCAGLRPVRVSLDLFGLIQQAVAFSELSHGCFDITVGALVDLWDLRSENFRVPSDAQVKERLPLVGFRRIRLDPKDSTVFLELSSMLITLGGIAKGYAVDRAVSAIRSLGVASGVVSAGGDLVAFGRKEDGGLWMVGVKNPRDEKKLVCVLPVSNAAVSTSGDYERFQIVEGVRYHHILDPGSGVPAKGCLSATVVAKRAVDSDALATAVFVMGPEQGVELLERLPDTEGVVIDGQGMLRATSGLRSEKTIESPGKEQNLGGSHL